VISLFDMTPPLPIEFLFETCPETIREKPPVVDSAGMNVAVVASGYVGTVVAVRLPSPGRPAVSLEVDSLQLPSLRPSRAAAQTLGALARARSGR
jgi:hypothetical protein